MHNEKQFSAKVVNKYRITVPKPIRELLKIKVGDFVDISICKSPPENQEQTSRVKGGHK